MVSEFNIRPYHWWLTLSLAIVLHTLILFNYRSYTQGIEDTNLNTNEIIINLKKLKAPPAAVNTPLPIQKQTAVEPPKPLPKKPKPTKTKVKKKPVTQLKKTPLVKPKVEPIIQQQPSIAPAKAAVRKSVKQLPVTTSPSAQNQAKASEKFRYMTQLSLWLNKHKKYPTIARRRGLEGELTIRFVIDRDGRLLKHELVKPSPHQSLNNAAIKMLKRASPMPAVPSVLHENSSEFEYTIPISFSLSNS